MAWGMKNIVICLLGSSIMEGRIGIEDPLDRWYNIFEIRASDGALKGWYCNITRPAHIGPDEVKAEDLALDLWVAPGGDMQVLDEDEFAALSLSPVERETARKALAELQARVARRVPPFSEVDDG